MEITEGYQKIEVMHSGEALEICLVLAGTAILVVGSYFYFYPKKTTYLFSKIFKRNDQKEKNVLSSHGQPKIIIRYDLPSNEQSQLLHTMKNALENITKNYPSAEGSEGEQLVIPFIPADDENDPELSHEEAGPGVTEDDEPMDDHILLGDLVNPKQP